MTRITVRHKGQVTLPHWALKAAGIAPGDRVDVETLGQREIVIRKKWKQEDERER